MLAWDQLTMASWLFQIGSDAKQNLLLLGLKEDCIWKSILEVKALDDKEGSIGKSR